MIDSHAHLFNEYYDDIYAHCTVVDYNIDVKKALREHPEFEEFILNAGEYRDTDLI